MRGMRTALARGVLALFLMLPALPAATSPAPGELRGLWVVRTALVSPQAVDQAVDAAAEAGINALFVQVRGRGDAFYRSRLAARSVLLERQPRDFDPLARLLARARVRRIQVHGWVNVLLAAHFGQPLPRGHVLEKHPDWAMVPKSAATAALVASGPRRLRLVMEAGRSEGDVEGYYLSPAIPAVGEHLEGVVRELVRAYPMDGLHLDFVRYPGPDFDYSRAALEGFRRVSGGTDLLSGPARSPAAWDGYRRQILTALVTRLADAARGSGRGSCSRRRSLPTRRRPCTTSSRTGRGGCRTRLLTALCPMTYTPDNELFQQQVEAASQRAGGARPVWAGIGAYRLDVAGIVEKVALARQSGARGVVLFSNESLDPADLRRLRDEAFASQLASDAEPRAGGRMAGSR